MRLLASGQKLTDRSEIGVMLQRQGPGVGEIIGHAGGGREIEVLDSVIRRIEDRIDENIPLAEMPADDRPDFRGEAGWVPMFLVEAELEIDAINEGPVGGIRDRKERAQLEAVIF